MLLKTDNPPLDELITSVMKGDQVKVKKCLAADPDLARQCLKVGATRETANQFFFNEIHHYLASGDTALHAAAAAYNVDIATMLLDKGADISARNRLGSQPLHYAMVGGPTTPTWDTEKQAECIVFLISRGADPNSHSKHGAAPLHMAVRQRCARAAATLIKYGAEVRLKNLKGSTPLHLAVQNTGRGGTGSDAAKEQQKEIIALLLKHGARGSDKDASGKTVLQCVKTDWIKNLLET